MGESPRAGYLSYDIQSNPSIAQKFGPYPPVTRNQESPLLPAPYLLGHCPRAFCVSWSHTHSQWPSSSIQGMEYGNSFFTVVFSPLCTVPVWLFINLSQHQCDWIPPSLELSVVLLLHASPDPGIAPCSFFSPTFTVITFKYTRKLIWLYSEHPSSTPRIN